MTARGDEAGGAAPLAVSFSTDDMSCCWSVGVGVVSADGRSLAVNASSGTAGAAPCVRLGAGVVTGNLPGALIEWTCTKPDGSYCGWPDWVRQ